MNGTSSSPLKGDQMTHFGRRWGERSVPVSALVIVRQIFDQKPSLSSAAYQYSATSCSASQDRTIFLFRYLQKFRLKVYLRALSRRSSPSSSVSQMVLGSLPTVKAVWMLMTSCSSGSVMRLISTVSYLSSVLWDCFVTGSRTTFPFSTSTFSSGNFSLSMISCFSGSQSLRFSVGLEAV